MSRVYSLIVRWVCPLSYDHERGVFLRCGAQSGSIAVLTREF